MSTVQAVKNRRAALQARRAELEGRLETAAGAELRALRLELAGVREDLAGCARQLRVLIPNHRVSMKTTWAGADGRRWDALQSQTWNQLEEEPEGPDRRTQMAQALRGAMGALTPVQAGYLAAVSQGQKQAEAARAAGVNRATVCRTVRRAYRELERSARCGLVLRTAAEEGTLNLAREDQLAALLELLTPRQQLYLYLYYGEWMSLGEVGSLLGVDRSTVLRGIQRAQRRILEAAGGPARVEGLERLGDLLLEHYSAIAPEDWQTPKERPRGARGAYARRGQAVTPADPACPGLVWAPGGGRLRAWLAARRAEAGAAGLDGRGAVRRLLSALLDRVRQTLRGVLSC